MLGFVNRCYPCDNPTYYNMPLIDSVIQLMRPIAGGGLNYQSNVEILIEDAHVQYSLHRYRTLMFNYSLIVKEFGTHAAGMILNLEPALCMETIVAAEGLLFDEEEFNERISEGYVKCILEYINKASIILSKTDQNLKKDILSSFWRHKNDNYFLHHKWLMKDQIYFQCVDPE